ncbi:ribose 5-phosphate isomerase [Patellaria atrata CBS 101060]|uniref:Ribose-5-phosphate isomerase n=1 Tax=Patellaria atrata CBS 101060 TaxID=1346257 RepID=A0A9P4VWJ3_9PEZI|nr:ribose 5-phosphate isomerase [Patellaria atrata CBS 101060]
MPFFALRNTPRHYLLPQLKLAIPNPYPPLHISIIRSYASQQGATKMTSKIEEAKQSAARKAVEDHFDPNFSYVGIGSGTTIIYVIEAIKERSSNPQIQFVPTGYQSRQAIVDAGLKPIAFDSLPNDVLLDVAFDGADEVDEDLNCIKGGGACLFQEKLVAERARKFVCVADYRKDQPRLLTTWPTIPIEIAPLSAPVVLSALRALGSPSPTIRSNKQAKAGPLKTDQDFFIVDAPFPPLLLPQDVTGSGDGTKFGEGGEGKWEVGSLAKRIKEITGVLDVGIFWGVDGAQALKEGRGKGGQRPVAVYFGLQDGRVKLRTVETGLEGRILD